MMQRHEILAEMGVQFQLNTEIGVDLSLDALLSTYDAIFIATGAYQSIKGNLSTESIQGVYEALPYLIANTRHLMALPASTDQPYIDLHKKRVVVLGGGGYRDGLHSECYSSRRCTG